ENEGLQKRVENRTHVIAKTFDRVCDVLTELNYIQGEKTLPQGQILAKIYTESDLLLAEAIRTDLLEHLSAPELLSVVSSMIFEARSQETLAPRIPSGNVQSALSEVVKLWSYLEDLESRHNVATQKEPDFGFCWISFRWANGHSLQSVLKGSDLSVGDFVRSTKQLIDLLNQIAVASESLRPKCKEAIKKIDRGVVAYFAGDV
ncbi:MAG: RNA helicase, partial [Actinobacteria bacterium]|nr:RNA helicase [Actinomycetota bacterium]